MKKILGSFVLFLLMFGLTGCGGIVEPKEVLENDAIKINGIYVDESYEDQNLALVYMFYTVKASAANLDISSKDIDLLINDVNTYESITDKDFIPLYTDYYYSDFIEELYVGNSLDVCATFYVAKGDLIDSKSVTLKDYEISTIGEIRFTTDKIKRMENIEKISEDLEKEVFDVKYAAREHMLAPADDATVNRVRNDINGYYFEFYANAGTSLSNNKLEFSAPDKFTITTSLSGASLSNNGTYTVRNGAIVLYYPSNGNEVVLEYNYDDGDITITNATSAFSTYIDYNGSETE